MQKGMPDAVREARERILAAAATDSRLFATADPLLHTVVASVLIIQPPTTELVDQTDWTAIAVAELLSEGWNTCMHEVLSALSVALGVK
jgi:hypothetical protein